jgi:hypothetical protein
MATEQEVEPETPHVAFVLEQTLGHITQTDYFRRLVPRDPAIDATFLPIDFDVPGLAARVPGFRNWSARAGVHARRAIRRAAGDRRFDAMSCTRRFQR